jgi:hypothetical protein
MALPASGAISLNDVNVELDLSATAAVSLNDAAVRGLFGVASGAINMADGYGKSNLFQFSVTTNQGNFNISSAATAAGWDGVASLEMTIDAGVYIYGVSTSIAALQIGSADASTGLSIINNGYIVGQGGAGGRGAYYYTFSSGTQLDSGGAGNGSVGGGAIFVVFGQFVTITNNGVIGGGGGGGGGGEARVLGSGPWSGGHGGGGGGGQSFATAFGGDGRTAVTTFGSTIAASNSGQSGSFGFPDRGGYGGVGGSAYSPDGGNGGQGGTWGTAGSSGEAGAGAYSFIRSFAAGGVGGYAVSGNSGITWVVEGTRYGSVS